MSQKQASSRRANPSIIRRRPEFRAGKVLPGFRGLFLYTHGTTNDQDSWGNDGARARKMSVFEKGIIGILGLGVVAAVATVIAVPVDRTTHSPRAELAVQNIETAAGPGPLIVKRGGLTKPGVAVARLESRFNRLDYDLDQLRKGRSEVPPVFIVSLPEDLQRVRVPARRKAIFFKAVLPLVLKINADIRRDRQRLELIRGHLKSDRRLAAADRLWLVAQTERYRLKRNDLKSLAVRMDLVPPSLALAQAAEESGWGRSRFAVEGNAIFGQWTFSRTGSLVPRQRDEGRAHRVRSFGSLIDAVAAYVHNLNTHRAYREFRAARATMRKRNKSLDGAELARTLTRYSERGKKYVRTIRSIINVNRLGDFDALRLRSEAITGTGKPVI